MNQNFAVNEQLVAGEVAVFGGCQMKQTSCNSELRLYFLYRSFKVFLTFREGLSRTRTL